MSCTSNSRARAVAIPMLHALQLEAGCLDVNPSVVCHGRYFAQAALFIAIASVLHVFDSLRWSTTMISRDSVPHDPAGLLSCPGAARRMRYQWRWVDQVAWVGLLLSLC
ncbi:hypothetical protein C8T65DRAFT_20985 [Cerioporus squamosus]|nr:hypothetical protein C8T65DRAFT_20985 [Cerioporus squamosus]